MKIFTNTKTLDRFIHSYTDYREDAEYIVLGSRKIEGIDKFTNLKGIFRCGVGMDNLPNTSIPIGMPSEKTKGIIYDEVSAFACSRILRLHYMNVGTVCPWKKTPRNSFASLNILVIGNGNIGKRVGRVMSNMCHVRAYDIDSDGSLEEYVRVADVVTLHLPCVSDTYEIVKTEWLKDNVILVNTARGNLVNEDDLFRFLSENQESQCAFDVFWNEPYKGKLLGLKNFYATPHVASTCQQFVEGLYSDFVKFVKGTSLGAPD